MSAGEAGVNVDSGKEVRRKVRQRGLGLVMGQELGQVMEQDLGQVVEQEVEVARGGGHSVEQRRNLQHANGRKLTAADKIRVAKVGGLICALYPGPLTIGVDLGTLVEDAYRTTDLIFGKREAISYGRGFEWPPGVRVRDIQRAVECQQSLELMAQQRQVASAHDRLSVERIEKVVSREDPDRALLLKLVTGMEVLVGPHFEPNNTPPKMRQLYKEVSGAVNKGLLKLWEADLVFIFPKEAMGGFGSIHYSPVHWTTKVGKESGRALFDSKDDSFGPALNSDAARELLEGMYGAIRHPSIDDIVRMILDYAAQCEQEYGAKFKWDDLILWKGDLKGAFTLLSFSAEGIRYLACELTDDLVLVYHTGLFGWTGTPFAFDVVSRVLRREIGRRINGRMTIYVDDLFGVTLKKFLLEDMAIARSVCEGLLGSQAMAEDKWETGRCVDVIGWVIDLERMRVSIARRNFLKIMYGYFAVDECAKVQVRTLVTLASWAARYKAVIRYAKPLTAGLYAEVRGMNNLNAYKELSTIGRQSILLWRVLLCMLHFDPDNFLAVLRVSGFRPLHTAWSTMPAWKAWVLASVLYRDPRGKCLV